MRMLSDKRLKFRQNLTVATRTQIELYTCIDGLRPQGLESSDLGFKSIGGLHVCVGSAAPQLKCLSQ